MSEWNWLLNVTCNDISVIYVTAHRCASGLKKKLNLRSGSQCHRHFVGFFSVRAPARGHPFYSYSEKPPYLVAFYDTLGIRRTYSHLKPPGSPRDDSLYFSTVQHRCLPFFWTFRIYIHAFLRFWSCKVNIQTTCNEQCNTSRHYI